MQPFLQSTVTAPLTPQTTISPKRKRGPTIVQPFAPRINISPHTDVNTNTNVTGSVSENHPDLDPHATPLIPVPDSPRTRVATQFESLRLRSGSGGSSSSSSTSDNALPMMMDFGGSEAGTSTAASASKKPRHTLEGENFEEYLERSNISRKRAAHASWQPASAAATATENVEIAETPQSSFSGSTTIPIAAPAHPAPPQTPPLRPSPPPPSSSPSVKLLLSSRNKRFPVKPKSKLLYQPSQHHHSPPPASSSTSATATTTTTASSSSTHTPRASTPDPSPHSLTWQDSEITGHLVDPATDPDDDGYGINGIGFRPTHAVAQARAQKRRQQVLEWRAREAREARQKRRERRGAGVGLGVDGRAFGHRRGSGSGSGSGSGGSSGGSGAGVGKGISKAGDEGKRRVVRFA